MPKQKRLTKSFVASRMKEVVSIPVMWHVKRVLDQKYCELDLRVVELLNLKEQCIYLFDVSHSRNITLEENETKAAKSGTNQATDADATEQWFRNPSTVLKLDVSLNNLESLSVEDLEPFAELRSLDASLNKITQFSGILSCPQLTSLCLAYNNIANLPLDSLAQCKYLYNLDLRSNQIRDLSKLPNLTSLEMLNVSHNLLKSLDGLQALRSLRKLSANDNKLENIVGLSACVSLQQVDLSNNQLPLIHDLVEVFKHLLLMQQLNMDRNPLTNGKTSSELQAEIVSNTTITLLDGVNIGSLKDQFSTLPMAKPPPADEPLKSTLKQAVRDAMWHNLKAQEKKHNNYLRYMHKKLLNMVVDMDEFREQSEVDTEAWCSYIDTLSAEEVNGLSVSKIRALALANPDGSAMDIDDKIARKGPPRKK